MAKRKTENGKVFGRCLPIAAVLSILGGGAGCGAPIDEGAVPDGSRAEAAELGSLGQALGEPSCATGSATATFQSTIDNYISPTTYSASGCFKAVKVDVENYTAAEGDWRSVVFWNASLPTSQAACESLWLASNLYESVGGAFEKLEFKSDTGSWNATSNLCTGPGVEWGRNFMPPGRTFRITASARTAQTGGAPTRRLGIATLPFSGGGGE
jgi:hypothetical protein